MLWMLLDSYLKKKIKSEILRNILNVAFVYNKAFNSGNLKESLSQPHHKNNVAYTFLDVNVVIAIIKNIRRADASPYFSPKYPPSCSPKQPFFQ